MLVYRIETENGDGPHGGVAASKVWLGEDWSDYMNDDNCHPTPWNDGLSKWLGDDDLIFGFESLADLKRWFYKSQWLNNLHDHNFRVSVYDAKGEIFFGERQIVFDRSMSTLKETISLKSL